jgi:hypothetical protein
VLADEPWTRLETIRFRVRRVRDGLTLRWAVVTATVVIALSGVSRADAPTRDHDEFEHRFIVGAGGAFELELTGVFVHGGGNLFFEWEAIENWLELELGVSALAAEGGVAVPIDLLLKKPFRLARRIELMVGLGPELVIYRRTNRDGQFFALEVAADFMFWLSPRVGLWIEPSYELTVRGGVEHSIASTGGLIVGW